MPGLTNWVLLSMSMFMVFYAWMERIREDAGPGFIAQQDLHDS